jgi:hypothetical protein
MSEKDIVEEQVELCINHRTPEGRHELTRGCVICRLVKQDRLIAGLEAKVRRLEAKLGRPSAEAERLRLQHGAEEERRRSQAMMQAARNQDARRVG